MKLIILLSVFFLSDYSLCNDEIKIISPDKFEIFKNKKVTQVFLIDKKSGKKSEIFNQFMRDEIQWIFSKKNIQNSFLIISRPMIAGAENSRFWQVKNGKTVLFFCRGILCF